MKYECENCGAFYSDEDVTEEGEMREDYLGVRFWATVHYCPWNASEEKLQIMIPDDTFLYAIMYVEHKQSFLQE